MAGIKIKVNGTEHANTSIPLDGSTVVHFVAYDADSGAALSDAICDWTILDVPEGTSFDSTWFASTDAANGGGVNDTDQLPKNTNKFIPDVEGTWFVRCTRTDTSVSDEAVASVRQVRTNIRVPAAGETNETSTTKGWALDRNKDLDRLDDLVTSGGVQLCYLQDTELSSAPWSSHGNGAVAGTLLQFTGTLKRLNPDNTESVPIVELAKGTKPFAGVLKGSNTGTTHTITTGTFVWVSRSGFVEVGDNSATAGYALDLSSFSVGETVFVGPNAASKRGLPFRDSDDFASSETSFPDVMIPAGIVVNNTAPGTILAIPSWNYSGNARAEASTFKFKGLGDFSALRIGRSDGVTVAGGIDGSIEMLATNQESSSVAAGTVVCISVVGGVISAYIADSSTDANVSENKRSGIFGVAVEAVASSAVGHFVVFGPAPSITTAGTPTAGDVLYVGSSLSDASGGNPGKGVTRPNVQQSGSYGKNHITPLGMYDGGKLILGPTRSEGFVGEIEGSSSAATDPINVNKLRFKNATVTQPSAGEALIEIPTGDTLQHKVTEVTLFEAAVDGGSLANVSTSKMSSTQTTKFDYTSAYLSSSTTEMYYTTFAIDERAVREGANNAPDASASNWMEYPLVAEIYGNILDDSSSAITLPTLQGRLKFNWANINSKYTTQATFSTTTGSQAFSKSGNPKEVVFRSSLISTHASSYKNQYLGLSPNESTITVKGTATSGGATTKLLDSVATFDSSLAGYYITFTSGAMKGRTYRIHSVTGTSQLNFTVAAGGYTLLSGTPAVGDSYIIDVKTTTKPPVSIDLHIGIDGTVHSGGLSYDVAITRIVLKSLYPAKKRAFRQSFYEVQQPGFTLLNKSGNSTHSATGGNPLFHSLSVKSASDFGTTSAGFDMSGSDNPAIGFIPFDNRFQKSRAHRLRVISKFRTATNASAISSETIGLTLTTLEQGASAQFDKDSLISGSATTVSVTPIVTAAASNYVTLVHDFDVTTSGFADASVGLWFKLGRVAVDGEYFYDGLASGSTKEEAFQISSIVFSEKDLATSSTKSEIFESSSSLFRIPEIAASNAAPYIRYPLISKVGTEFFGMNFAASGSQQSIVPISIDERHNDRESISVSVFGFVTEANKSVTLKLSTSSGYAATDLSAPAEIGSTTVTSSSSFTGSNDAQFMEHQFTIPRASILSGSGLHQGNEAAPNDEKRTTFYLKIDRTDTTGATNYYAFGVRCQSTAAKVVTGADPHIDISEDSSNPLIVGGSFRHDKIRDVLLSAHRHNWSFKCPRHWDYLSGSHSSPGLPPGGKIILLPSNFSEAPVIMYGSKNWIGNFANFKKTDLQSNFGGVPSRTVGREYIGKHIPFSMAITAVHGWVAEPDVTVPDTDGDIDSAITSESLEWTPGSSYSATFHHANAVPLLGSQVKIVFRVVEIPGSSAITDDSNSNAAMGYNSAQSDIASDNQSAIVNFPLEVYPGASLTTGGGAIRWVGTGLTTGSSSHTNKGPLPQVYLPSDYANSREYMLVAELHNITSGSSGTHMERGQQLFPIIDLNVEVAFLPNPNVDMLYG